MYTNNKYKIINRNVSDSKDRKVYQYNWGKEVCFDNIDQVLEEIKNDEIRTMVKEGYINYPPKYYIVYNNDGEIVRIHRIGENIIYYEREGE